MSLPRDSSGRSSSFSVGKVIFFALIICCFLSAMNVLNAHSSSSLSLGADTAIHQAMKDFVGKPPKRKKRVETSEKRPQGRVFQEETPSKKLEFQNTPKMDLKGEGETKEEVIKVAIEEQKELGSEEKKAEPAPKPTTTASSPYLAKLSCKAYGGPDDEFAQEMVYWEDIPSDSRYVSPFRANAGQKRQYMTFEPDGGGWNNIRMAMETVLGLGIAMGRTIVMPPEKRMYLLARDAKKQKTNFHFSDFFPVEEMKNASDGLELMTMKEFLEAEAMTGNLRDKNTGEVSFPPENRTEWDGEDFTVLKEWLRNVTHTPLWSPGKCLAAFPASGDHKDVVQLQSMQDQIHSDGVLHDEFLENPVPVDATPMERMRENLAKRKELCVYDEEMQKFNVVHFMCYHKLRVRMLVHFYAFLFLEDWREDLWMKRFMRDHVRYTDEIQCAAARIVHAMREYARSKGDPNGIFDTFHIRRGDFQYKVTRISAEEIYNNTQDVLTPGAVLYIATDERDKSFFDPLKEHYDIKFLDDFKDLLTGVNTNFYGMIDQLVASRGRLFFGCWHSTFTGFINRMRGYHSVKDKLPGHEKGLLPNSYYYSSLDRKFAMHKYAPLQGAFFNREFPTSWRDLDKGVDHLPDVLPEISEQ